MRSPKEFKDNSLLFSPFNMSSRSFFILFLEIEKKYDIKIADEYIENRKILTYNGLLEILNNYIWKQGEGIMEVLGVQQNYIYSNLNSKESSNTDSQFLQYIHEMSENREIDSFQLLENKYGKIIYNVGDASNFSYWDRNDFPIEQLFMENIDVATLYRWEPKNKKSNPSGFEKSIQDRLKGIKDGSRSVLIHPNIEKKMKQDPQYAKSIYNMIDTYFQNDIMINESILPGSTYADDEDRTIGYKDGSLYDIDTNYGFGPGQTAWIDSRREQNEKDKAEYMRERAETLRREESMPNRYERAFVDVEKLGGGKMNWAADGSYGDLFPNGALEQGGQTSLFDYIGGGTTGAIRDEMLKDGISAPELITSMLNERMTNAVRSGTGALASEMFGIPGTTVRRRGMNLRA